MCSKSVCTPAAAGAFGRPALQQQSGGGWAVGSRCAGIKSRDGLWFVCMCVIFAGCLIHAVDVLASKHGMHCGLCACASSLLAVLIHAVDVLASKHGMHCGLCACASSLLAVLIHAVDVLASKHGMHCGLCACASSVLAVLIHAVDARLVAGRHKPRFYYSRRRLATGLDLHRFTGY